MQAAIKKMTNGSVALTLDADAARAVFASVLFAARFHERISPLARIAKEELERGAKKPVRRGESCQ
jgi:hypothetical protein